MIRALLKWTLDRTRSREEEFVKISLERYQFARQRREMKDATIRSLFEETQLIQAGEIDVNKARDTLAQLQNAYEQLAEAQKLRQGQTSRYHEAHQWLANERVRYFKRHNGEQDPIYHFSQLFEIHSMLDLFPFGARRLTDKNIIEKIAELDCALVAMLAHEIVAVMIHEKTANKNLIERQQVKLVSDIQRETRTNGSALRMLIDHIHYGRRERAELEKLLLLLSLIRLANEHKKLLVDCRLLNAPWRSKQPHLMLFRPKLSSPLELLILIRQHGLRDTVLSLGGLVDRRQVLPWSLDSIYLTKKVNGILCRCRAECR